MGQPPASRGMSRGETGAQRRHRTINGLFCTPLLNFREKARVAFRRAFRKASPHCHLGKPSGQRSEKPPGVSFRSALQGCHPGSRSGSIQQVDSLTSRVKVLQKRNDSAATRTRVFKNGRGASTNNSTPKSSKQNKTFAEQSGALTCKNQALADRGKKMPLESCEAAHSASLCLTLLAGASLRTWKQAGNNMV